MSLFVFAKNIIPYQAKQTGLVSIVVRKIQGNSERLSDRFLPFFLNLLQCIRLNVAVTH